MKIRYFPDTDTLSIRLNNRPSAESEEVAPDVIVDFDADGGVVGRSPKSIFKSKAAIANPSLK